MKINNKYKFVNFLWDKKKETDLKKSQIDLFLYRSNLLGSDLRITNFGGGNTSCKTVEKDPITKNKVNVMWIKGSGGDIGTLKRDGIAGLYVDKIHELKKVYKGLDYEDDMVKLINHCIYDLDSKPPSIDTALHALLPFKHIDHLHPDSLISIAASKNSEKLTQEIWDNEMGWVPWQRPGFDLALNLERCLKNNPNIKGIVLGGHGVFTWGESSYECYVNSLNVIEAASKFIELKQKKEKNIFGGVKVVKLTNEKRIEQAVKIFPILRRFCSSENKMIGHFSDSNEVMEFINSNKLQKLAPMGTSCPDHFLRTKIKPMILNIPSDFKLSNDKLISNKIEPIFEKYRKDYIEYYENCKKENSPKIRDSNPVVILYPGVGMFTFAKNKQTSRIASEFYINAINVMRGAEAISSYTSLSRQEAFNIEYWSLEEAKLKRQPAEKPLTGKVALVTGAGGGIGKAISEKLIDEGANVIFIDISDDNFKDLKNKYNSDQAFFCKCDVTKSDNIEETINKSIMKFGGLDILVNSAGLAISKSIENTTEKDWDKLQSILVKGQFLFSKQASKLLKIQNLGGDIVNIVSKNGISSGPNNIGYGTAKAAQLHMSRLMATELAEFNIKVNCLNPDGVIIGSKIWKGSWAEERAKSHGIKVSQLPEFYAKRNLLNQIIKPEDIANGVFGLLTSLNKSTGNIINIDGGIPQAFVR